MNIYSAAKQFDKSYESFRMDVYPFDADRYIRVYISFHSGSNAAETISTATRELYMGIAHQVRPFGRSKLTDDIYNRDFKMNFFFDEKRISDVGVTTLMKKIIALAENISLRYNL